MRCMYTLYIINACKNKNNVLFICIFRLNKTVLFFSTIKSNFTVKKKRINIVTNSILYEIHKKIYNSIYFYI